MWQSNERWKRRRRRLADDELKRVEIVVPVEDRDRLKRLAKALRRNDATRDEMRRAIDAKLAPESAANGLSLFPFLGNPLFRDFELELPDRNTDSYTPVDFSEE